MIVFSIYVYYCTLTLTHLHYYGVNMRQEAFRQPLQQRLHP